MFLQAIMEHYLQLFQILVQVDHLKYLIKIFDKESSLIFLNSPKTTFSDTNSSHVNIMLNRALYRLFNSLTFKLVNKSFNTLDGTTQTTTSKTLYKLN